MKRLSAILLSVLIAAASMSAAEAQDRRGGGRDDDRDDRRSQMRDACPQPSMSASQAQGIARSQAPRDAVFKSSRQTCGVYTFTFEHNGRIMNIQVDGRR